MCLPPEATATRPALSVVSSMPLDLALLRMLGTERALRERPSSWSSHSPDVTDPAVVTDHATLDCATDRRRAERPAFRAPRGWLSPLSRLQNVDSHAGTGASEQEPSSPKSAVPRTASSLCSTGMVASPLRPTEGSTESTRPCSTAHTKRGGPRPSREPSREPSCELWGWSVGAARSCPSPRTSPIISQGLDTGERSAIG